MVNNSHTVLMIFVSAALATTGCYQKRSPVTPITFKYYESGNSPSTTLRVLLPDHHDTINELGRCNI